MFIRITSKTAQFDLIPRGFTTTEGNRVILPDVANAKQFLEQFRDNPLAMARLNDLHDHLIGPISATRLRDDDGRIQQLAEAITGLSGGQVAVIRREEETQSRWHGAGTFPTTSTPEPVSRPITDYERRRWAEALETKPVPEQQYKIVIEVAGKHLEPLDGHLDLRRLPNGDDYGHDTYFKCDTGSDAHRVVLRFDNVPNKPRQLYYVIGTYNLPLCMNIIPVEREAEVQQWSNVLIPLAPVYNTKSNHLTPNNDSPEPSNNSPEPDNNSSASDPNTIPPTSAFTALPPGWLYVYLNGYLWREVQVDSYAGVLRDVKLPSHPCQHQRPAEGQPFHLLLVPHKLNGITQTVQLAYSRRQWTWTQLCQAGGIDPNDRGFLPHIKQRSARTPVDPAFQQAHLNTLDFTRYDRGFEVTTEATTDATTENPAPSGYTISSISTAPKVMFDDPPMLPRDLLAKYRHLNIPVVTLNDIPNTNIDVELCFQLVTETGQVIKNIPYKTAFTGTTVSDLHLNDGNTDAMGKTTVVSTTINEAIDFYVVWSKVNINKNFFKR
ncbi:MAG: hypothetical protein GXP08_17870 [Gammaproteobacteria bacterium]|nr:hypothetical protein [Gammaproteobacteria bacterium]